MSILEASLFVVASSSTGGGVLVSPAADQCAKQTRQYQCFIEIHYSRAYPREKAFESRVEVEAADAFKVRDRNCLDVVLTFRCWNRGSTGKSKL